MTTSRQPVEKNLRKKGLGNPTIFRICETISLADSVDSTGHKFAGINFVSDGQVTKDLYFAIQGLLIRAVFNAADNLLPTVLACFSLIDGISNMIEMAQCFYLFCSYSERRFMRALVWREILRRPNRFKALRIRLECICHGARWRICNGSTRIRQLGEHG